MYGGKIDPDFRFKISRKNLQINLVRGLITVILMCDFLWSIYKENDACRRKYGEAGRKDGKGGPSKRGDGGSDDGERRRRARERERREIGGAGRAVEEIGRARRGVSEAWR